MHTKGSPTATLKRTCLVRHLLDELRVPLDDAGPVFGREPASGGCREGHDHLALVRHSFTITRYLVTITGCRRQGRKKHRSQSTVHLSLYSVK